MQARQASGCEIQLYHHPREFPPDVLALFGRAEALDIEAGPTWYANLVDTVFPAPGQALFYVLRRDGAVRAALPLLRVQRRLGCELEALGNFYTSLWTPALAPQADGTDLVVLLQDIRRRHPGLAQLRLAPLDPQAPATRLIGQALRDSGFLRFDYFRFKNWFLRDHGGWSAYLATRKGKLRSDLKRMNAKLAEQGGDTAVICGGGALDEALAEYQRVYETSWKRPEPFVEFIPGLVRAAAERGWLRLGLVRLQGKAIAAQIWLVHQGRASIFKVAYDEAYKAYSPGTVLTARLMQHVIEQDGVEVVDYLIGDDAYKRIWMSDCRERVGMQAFNPRSLGGLLGALREWLAVRSQPLRQALRRRREAAHG